jgi:hypothetical protein
LILAAFKREYFFVGISSQEGVESEGKRKRITLADNFPFLPLSALFHRKASDFIEVSRNPLANFIFKDGDVMKASDLGERKRR